MGIQHTQITQNVSSICTEINVVILKKLKIYLMSIKKQLWKDKKSTLLIEYEL